MLTTLTRRHSAADPVRALRREFMSVNRPWWKAVGHRLEEHGKVKASEAGRALSLLAPAGPPAWESRLTGSPSPELSPGAH